METLHPERRTPTFRQFAMAMAAVTWFAVLLPVGATAAGQLVTIVDEDSSSTAQVDDGFLRVGDGTGPLTVDGTVASRSAVAGRIERFERLFPGDYKFVNGPFPANVKIAFTSVTVTNYSSTLVSEFDIDLYSLKTKRGCNQPGATVDFLLHVLVQPGETLHLPFPQPLVAGDVPPDHFWCLKYLPIKVSAYLDVMTVGYSV